MQEGVSRRTCCKCSSIQILIRAFPWTLVENLEGPSSDDAPIRSADSLLIADMELQGASILERVGQLAMPERRVVGRRGVRGWNVMRGHAASKGKNEEVEECAFHVSRLTALADGQGLVVASQQAGARACGDIDAVENAGVRRGRVGGGARVARRRPSLANLVNQYPSLDWPPRTGRSVPMKLAFPAISLLLLTTGLVSLLPTVSADCGVNLAGNCDGGNCPVNVYGDCTEGGSCVVNAVLSACQAECTINAAYALCLDEGNCIVNVFLATCRTFDDLYDKLQP